MIPAMKRLDAHSKLVSLLCFALLAMGSLPLLFGLWRRPVARPEAANASPFETYDQVVDAFDQIVRE